MPDIKLRSDSEPKPTIDFLNYLLALIGIIILASGLLVYSIYMIYDQYSLEKDKTMTANINFFDNSVNNTSFDKVDDKFWKAPELNNIADEDLKDLIMYGKELIMHTSIYLGPKGKIASISNGMNCQNCHLDGGTKIFGNNYGSVASTYPKFRARSGEVEDIYKRVNDCFERSLNGSSLDTLSKEMQAIKAYISFLGSNVKEGEMAEGSGLKNIPYLDRKADIEKGKKYYIEKCQLCHQANGEGIFNPEGTEYVYPALWGPHSYNDAAGLFRISNFAKYIKYNMPQGATHTNPMLTDEEAWDIAAFVNAQPRPHKSVPQDWPDISKKPLDHPFGPYADEFSEEQHKFGPYKQIVSAKETKK